MSPTTPETSPRDDRMEIVRNIPFALVHVACLAAFWVDFHWWCIPLCLAMYYVRMFGITGAYHRYFSHRGYKTSRVMQFLLAFLGGTAAQKGALWWASHHRHHHKFSDEDEDVHSPTLKGFWWSHIGWVLSAKYKETDWALVNDFAKYPELRFMNTHYWMPPAILGVVIWLIGGWSALVWGFVISTVLLWHGTFFINSLAHVFGRRRFPTTDTSRNSFLLSVITLGEGWHNNHHHYPNTANNGFYWWELDVTYYVIWMMSKVGLVWDLRLPPQRVLEQGRRPFEELAAMAAAARTAVVRMGESAGEAARTATASAAEAARTAGETAIQAGEAAAEAAREVIQQLQPFQPATEGGASAE